MQLRAKLYELELQQRRSEQQAIEDAKADIGWGVKSAAMFSISPE